MKKIITTILALGMILSLISCGKVQPNVSTDDTQKEMREKEKNSCFTCNGLRGEVIKYL